MGEHLRRGLNVAFGNPSKLAGALLEAAMADLSNTGTRETFEQGAPAVVQRLAELGEGDWR